MSSPLAAPLRQSGWSRTASDRRYSDRSFRGPRSQRFVAFNHSRRRRASGAAHGRTLLQLGGDPQQQVLPAGGGDELDADRQVVPARQVGTDIAGCPVMLNGAVKTPKGTMRASARRRVAARRCRSRRGRGGGSAIVGVSSRSKPPPSVRPPARHPARPRPSGLQRFDVGRRADRAADARRAPR